jgi:hypothetical protein
MGPKQVQEHCKAPGLHPYILLAGSVPRAADGQQLEERGIFVVAGCEVLGDDVTTCFGHSG